VALPDGYDFQLLGVTGEVMDLLPWVNYHEGRRSRAHPGETSTPSWQGTRPPSC
jgi:hypothetical protein